MPKVHRKAHGQPLRDEMRRQGLSGPGLAEKTREVDPTGRGVSAATIGRIAGRGSTARERCELSTAWLIAEVLDAPIHRLFSLPPPFPGDG
ncbi:XRE family transcriptional regulator [Streptomyces sp. 8L]|uniref:XRE family transcriptional regulator n=1 Tax=unclassified Streptomyces TaxID=2593676 RepID=UPI001CD29EFA|nr:XRE family transcriptional regulator [Streptomyces sp. 8L]MCA1220513.1 XRE family transcriptional regulator [Streptomyces sp. 8L]